VSTRIAGGKQRTAPAWLEPWEGPAKGTSPVGRSVVVFRGRLRGVFATAAAYQPARHPKNESAGQAAKELGQRGGQDVHRVLRAVRCASAARSV
jgi:hypothetical protein